MWGFSPLSWKSILSIFGALYLLIIPFIPIALFQEFLGALLESILDESDSRIRRSVNEADEQQTQIESKLEEQDDTGLIPLIRYSRLQLQAYYELGLTQTQRSFFTAL
jgi:hypothetical protein